MKSYLHLQQFISHPINFLDQKVQTGELIQKIKLGPKTFILVFDPEVASSVLIQKADIYRQNRGVFDRIKPVTGKRGLVQLEGEESRKYRRETRPIFTPSHMANLKNIIEAYIEETLDEIPVGSSVDIMKLMTDFTIRTAFKMFLGIDIKKSNYPFGENFLELNRLCGKAMLSPINLPSLRIRKLKNSLRSEIKKVILEHKGDLNIISVFKDSDDLIDQCMTFLFAGHETTAASLAFSFSLLAQHPEYQKRINPEDDLALKVYKESLRLHPPAYMLAREAVSEDQLGHIRVQKGDQVLIGLKQIQRLEKYFTRPHDFIPERFHESHAHCFFPFGKGPKSCIGESLAYLEAVVVIKAFCRRFTLTRESHDLIARPFITLHPEKEVLHVS